MRKICLKFLKLRDLLEFVDLSRTVKFALIPNTFNIVCELTEADIELAMNAFAAEIVSCAGECHAV